MEAGVGDFDVVGQVVVASSTCLVDLDAKDRVDMSLVDSAVGSADTEDWFPAGNLASYWAAGMGLAVESEVVLDLAGSWEADIDSEIGLKAVDRSWALDIGCGQAAVEFGCKLADTDWALAAAG